MLFYSKFRFNSAVVLTYFVITALSFTLLLLFIWREHVKVERADDMQHDSSLIMEGLFYSILRAVELNARGLQQQSQAFLQKSLSFTFDFKKELQTDSAINRVTQVQIYSLTPKREMIGSWNSGQNFAPVCLLKKTEYFKPEKSEFSYFIDLTLNSCAYNSFNSLNFHGILTPVLISSSVIFIWGVCILLMLRSVKYAGKLLEQSENVDELFLQSEKINWTNVRVLAQKAIIIKGKNLLYFQNIILDAQHDMAKILDAIDRSYKSLHNKELNRNLSMMRGIMQRLAIEVRSSDENNEKFSVYKEIDVLGMISFLKSCFLDVNIQNNLPINCKIPVTDISLFERIIVNLASNSQKHTIKNSHIKLFFENNLFRIRVYSTVSFLSSLKIRLAKWTSRIDVKNSNSPVYFKLSGRTGRGLSIVKRGIIKLGGSMIFSLRDRTLETGFNLPALLEEKRSVENLKLPVRKRVIFFKNEEFLDRSIECGLKKYMVTKTELNHLIRKMRKEERLEIVSDENIELPDPCILKLVTKKERIEGLAVNWVGEARL